MSAVILVLYFPRILALQSIKQNFDESINKCSKNSDTLLRVADLKAQA